MGRLFLLVLAATLAAPATAAACGAVPAGFADDVRIHETFRVGRDVERTWTSLCVRAAGRRIVLRRAGLLERTRRRPGGAIVGGAAPAGRRVAWMETRYGRRTRTSTLHVVRIGRAGRPRPVRRKVVRRDRSRDRPDLDVAITARGELAWLAPVRRPAGWNRVVYAPPGGPARTLETTFAAELAIEDRITLRWDVDGYEFGFYELPRSPTGRCPQRSRFRTVASSDAVTITQRYYDDRFRQVLRACLHATGRDRVIAQANEGEGNGDTLLVPGVDRNWAAVLRISSSRYDPCGGGFTLSTTDARTGKVARETEFDADCETQPAVPVPGTPLAITTRGVAAWVDDERLLAAAPGRGITELDRGAIAGLRARGADVEWTRDGAPRSMELP